MEGGREISRGYMERDTGTVCTHGRTHATHLFIKHEVEAMRSWFWIAGSMTERERERVS